MAMWDTSEGRGWEWATPMSPPSALQLDIDELAAEPFSNKFTELFGYLGFHTEPEAEDNTATTLQQSTSYDIESFSGMNEILPGWQHPDIEEIVVLSSKKRPHNGLPTILEDNAEPPCSIAPVAALSDFEFEFDAFDGPPIYGMTKNATICTRRDNGNKYIIKRKKAARNASWSEQTILETLTNLETSFVSRVYWSFHSGEHIYMVMDYLPGRNFLDLIRDHGPLGIHHATLYASELVAAISGLHAAGIMHRDIEPRNVLLDSKGHIVIVNFGLAEFDVKDVSGSQPPSVPFDLGCTSTVYRAPELLLGWSHDISVDCWSFGMLVYYMVFGMHPFGGREGVQDDYAWTYDHIIRSSIPTESLRLVHPMSRDLILKCLERNPAMRWDMKQIKSHPYFASIDWQKVGFIQIDIPVSKTPPVVQKKPPTTIYDTHQRYSSLDPPLVDCDALKRVSIHPFAQSAESVSTGISDSPSNAVSPLAKFFEPFSYVETAALQNSFKPLSRVVEIIEEEPQSLADTSDDLQKIVCEPRFVDTKADRIAQFWDDLDKEQGSSAISINSLEFGQSTGMPYNKAPKLRKYRSAMQSRSRLFNVSTASFHSRLQKKPRSTGALRPPRPVEVIENLPLGVHQIGSGIGFKYNVPTAVPSKVSVMSFAPSCQLFQRGFSVRNLGIKKIGGAHSTKAKTKFVTPSTFRLPLNETTTTAATATTTTIAASPETNDVGNGAFIRAMCQSPTWILSPPENLPSPLALVHSPASSSETEPLSPATLGDAIGDQDCHINIPVPEELDFDSAISAWAPTSTLRLVPSTPKLPYLETGETSESIYADTIG